MIVVSVPATAAPVHALGTFPDPAVLLTVLCGIAYLVTAVALGLWQMLSAPDRPNYPTSGPFKRLVMFWAMAAWSVLGLQTLNGLPTRTATGMEAGAAILMAALFTIFLIDHVQHWLPARTQQRLRQVRALASCRRRAGLIAARTSAMRASTGRPCPSADVVGPALTELALQGLQVAPPGAGPEAVTGVVAGVDR